jgi:hypothetical protein
MIVKWKNKKDVLSATLMIKCGQDMKKPNVVTHYNSRMGGVDLSDAYLTSSTSKKTKKILSKALPSFD